jgi:MFS transporter, ACS family, hexuronate transporter
MNRVGRFRWVICALLFAATLINYMDRQVLGLLKPELTKVFHWSEQDYGNIIVAFQAAYAFSQMVAGPIIEWVGMRFAFTGAIIFWSLAAMAHALARSVFGFGIARVALGLGEGMNFPACVRTVTEWFPQRERSVATGLFNSGSNLGAIVAPLLVWVLFENFGWKMAFIILGLAGFVWLVFWLMLYQPLETSRRVNAEERAYIEGEKVAKIEQVPWQRLFAYREAWVLWFTGILVGPVWWFYLFWLPDIFSKQFGMNLKQFGPPLAVIYGIAAIGSIGGGGLSAWFLRRGWTVNAARKTAGLICALCTVPVVFIPHLQNVWVATALFALATAAHQGWSATFYTVTSDIFPKQAVGSMTGFGGTCSGVASMYFSWLVGHVLQGSGVYDKILLVCGSAYVVALLAFHLVVPTIKPVKLQ